MSENDWEPDMSKEFDGPVMAQLVANNDALRARVAKLEAALKEAREWLSGWASAEKELAVIDAALTPPPPPSERSGDGAK